MDKVSTHIARRSIQLHSSQFCKWLQNPNIKADNKRSFIPSMTFWVLGIKDIINELTNDTPCSNLEKELQILLNTQSINWLSYLNDLETLRFDYESWGHKPTHMFMNIWSQENFPTRDFIYDCMAIIKNETNQKIRYYVFRIILEAQQIILKSINDSIQDRQASEELVYFTNTNIIEVECLTKVELSDYERIKLRVHTDELFDLLEKVFQRWYQSRNTIKAVPKSGIRKAPTIMVN